MKYRAVVIGASAGGLEAITEVLSSLGQNWAIPIIIAMHRSPDSDRSMVEFLDDKLPLKVKEAESWEKISSGTVYFAAPDYHLLVEKNEFLTYSLDAKVNFSRPSIDVLFETSADVYKENLIGIILTGANNDGSEGLKKIKNAGGLTIVQAPETAEHPEMPKAAISTVGPDYVLPLNKIGGFLNELCV